VSKLFIFAPTPIKHKALIRCRQGRPVLDMVWGFTLLEILLVIGIISILLVFIVPISLDFYKSQQLETQTQSVIQTLRRAQSKATVVELDSSFGVYFGTSNYTLFKGSSYFDSGRDSQYDEIFDFPEIINIGGLDEIVFLKSEGVPKGSPAYCEGICTPCGQFTNRNSCRQQDGCSWSGTLRRCQGNCTFCNSYQDQPGCEDQSGCTWQQEILGGNILLSVDNKTRTININEIGRVNLE
jgi:prepilin-type N-terminal cleavage/methylation domain-containing protein